MGSDFFFLQPTRVVDAGGYIFSSRKTNRFLEPKVMEIWLGSVFFPFRMRDFQVNHVKFEGSALPGTNKYTI